MCSFRRVKNSHVFVTRVKNSFQISTCVTNTWEFFTRVTDSFECESQTNLVQVCLALAQQDIEASLMDKFHSNLLSSF